MRDINITILSNGTAQIDEPSCFCGEHNAARLCITLSSELKTDASYYLLSFSSDGMSRRIVSNTIKDSASTPANVINGVIYCPLPEELTEMGDLSVQVEAHRLENDEVTRVVRSAVFTLGFEASIMGCGSELEKSCGMVPQLAGLIERLSEESGRADGATFTPSVSEDGVLSWTNNKGLENPASVNIKGSDGGSVPSYVKAEAEKTVSAALSHEAERPIRFVALSDAHQRNDNEVVCQSNMHAGQGAGEILKMIGVDFAAFLGDAADGAADDTVDTVKAQIEQFNAYISNAFKGQTQLRAEGDHDDGSYSLAAYPDTPKLTAAATDALIWAHGRGITRDPDHPADGYGYIDIPSKKLRVVVLNTEHGTGDAGIIGGYQLKWFAETALDMGGKTDWQLMTLAHHPLSCGTQTLQDAVTVLDAFISGQSLSMTSSGTAIKMDYYNRYCTYIGHFHGHVHTFSTVQMKKKSGSTGTDICAWEIGVPNCGNGDENRYSASSDAWLKRFSTSSAYSKTRDSAEDTSFCLVTVDPDNMKIYADCYGAGIDRAVQYSFSNSMCTVTDVLTNCSNKNLGKRVAKGKSYSAMLNADKGYQFQSISVSMGGTDITSSAVNGGSITIGNVTGDIVITATAVAQPTDYTNQLPNSTDTDGSIYNGTGFKCGPIYVDSVAIKSGYEVTGLIPVPTVTESTWGKAVMYIKGASLELDANTAIFFYDADRKHRGVKYGNALSATEPTEIWTPWVTVDSSNHITKIDMSKLLNYLSNLSSGYTTAYIRISGSGIGLNTIITVNEEIS